MEASPDESVVITSIEIFEPPAKAGKISVSHGAYKNPGFPLAFNAGYKWSLSYKKAVALPKNSATFIDVESLDENFIVSARVLGCWKK